MLDFLLSSSSSEKFVNFVKWLSKNRKYFLPILGIVVFFIYIYIFNTNIVDILVIISHTNVLLFVVAAIVELAELFFFTLSWRVLLDFLKIKITVVKAYLFVLYSFYMDIVVPAGSVTGDVTRVYLISKEKNGVETEAAATVFIQRLLGMIFHVASILIGIVLILLGSGLNKTLAYYVAGFGGIMSIALVLVLLIIAKKSLSHKILDNSLSFFDKVTKKRWNVSRWRERAHELIEKFRNSTISFRKNPSVLANSVAYLILNWLCSFYVPYIIFLALGYPVSWSVIIVTTSIVLAVRSIPIGLPFEVGIPEITMTTLFVALGVPAGISATATLLTRALTLWFRFALGFIAQQWVELKPEKLKID